MNTVGIFGGTFDPVHNGHISLVRQAQAELSLDSIHFLPCAIPVHRDLPLASDEDRVQMLKLAIAGESRWLVNTVEIDREGPSYMVDSLQLVRQKQPRDILILLLGVDAFNAFQRWRLPETILELAHLVVCRRPDVIPDREVFSEHYCNNPALLSTDRCGHIFFLDIEENPCSSSHVRQSLLQSGSAPDCLSPGVSRYIQQHRLYEVMSE